MITFIGIHSFFMQIFKLGMPSKFSSKRIPRNIGSTGFPLFRGKSAPFAEFLCLGIAHSEVWNKIPIVFLFWEMVQNKIPSIFIFRGMVWNKITKFRVFFLRIGLERISELFLSSAEWFRTEFRTVSVSQNRRNQSKFLSVPCSAESFFSSEIGSPNTNHARIVSTEPHSYFL